MEGRDQKPVVIFDGETGAATSSAQDVRSYRNVVFAIAGASSPDATVKFFGSIAKNATTPEEFPAMSTAASASNMHTPVAFADLNSGSIVDGDTGIVFSGSAGVHLVEVNTNAIASIGVDISGYSAGAITVIMYVADNE